jgi:transcriptional regulator with XRE-family HTH domain
MEEKNEQKPKNIYVAAFEDGMAKGEDLNRARADMRVTIAQRIRACRAEFKLKQEEVAERINANSLTYRGYENCRSDIPIVYLVRLADLFSVSLDYLTGRTENKTHAETDKTATVEERLAMLEKAIAEMSKE